MNGRPALSLAGRVRSIMDRARGSMADLSSLLAVIEHDPDDAQALDALAAAARVAVPEARTARFAAARKVLSMRNRPDAVDRKSVV